MEHPVKEEFTDIIAFDAPEEALEFLEALCLPQCDTNCFPSWNNGCTSERCKGDCAHHTPPIQTRRIHGIIADSFEDTEGKA